MSNTFYSVESKNSESKIRLNFVYSALQSVIDRLVDRFGVHALKFEWP